MSVEMPPRRWKLFSLWHMAQEQLRQADIASWVEDVATLSIVLEADPDSIVGHFNERDEWHWVPEACERLGFAHETHPVMAD